MVSRVSQAVLGIFLAVWLLVNWPVVDSLRKHWTINQNYSHGYLIVLIVAYLIYQSLPQLRRMAPKPALTPLLLLLAVAAVSFFGRVAQVQLLQQMALPAALWLGLAAAFGWRIGWALLFPFALLYSIVPMWDFITLPLRATTVFITQHILDWMDIPAFVDGFRIHLPAGIVLVEDGCAGVNYFLIATVISVLMAAWSFRTWQRRIAIIAIAMGIGLLSNWVRVTALVLLAHYTEMRSEIVHDHGGFGWMIFAGALVLLFVIAKLMEERHHPPVEAVPVTTAPAPWPKVVGFAACALLIAMAAPAWSYWRQTYAQPPAPAPLAAPVAAAQPLLVGWRPHYEGYDREQRWLIEWRGRAYELLALTYFEQRRDKKLIYYRNRIAGETRLRATRSDVAVGADLSVNQALLSEPGGARAVWWFYLIGEHTATRTYRAKWLQFGAELANRPDASLVALSLSCQQPCAQEMEHPPAELLQQIANSWTVAR